MAQSEKEKMLAGEYYNAADDELLTRWHLAKKTNQRILSGRQHRRRTAGPHTRPTPGLER